jgi:hypothetical protein
VGLRDDLDAGASTGGPFPGGKVRPGRDADHSPPSSAEVENEQELYLLSPQAPSWRVAGQFYLFFFFFTMADNASRRSTFRNTYQSMLK